MTNPRTVRRIIQSHRQREGAGFIVRRPVPTVGVEQLDPFLLVDEMGPITYAPGEAVGAPDHPHRGFETVTYVLQGEAQHEDSAGHRGTIGPGDVQWMTAGGGIVHSEEPSDAMKRDGGTMHGFQLWVNLPASHKMVAPRYQDLAASALVHVDVQDSAARLIAGTIGEHRGPVSGIVTEPHMIDVSLRGRGRFEHPVPPTHNAFAYVIEGRVRFERDGTDVPRGHLVVLERGVPLVRATSRDGGRFLLLAGEPIGESIARRGPFVMNTEAELDRAVEEYRAGTLTRL